MYVRSVTVFFILFSPGVDFLSDFSVNSAENIKESVLEPFYATSAPQGRFFKTPLALLSSNMIFIIIFNKQVQI